MCAQLEAVARQRGDRENLLAARLGYRRPLELGRWEEALAGGGARAAAGEPVRARGRIDAALVHCERGRLESCGHRQGRRVAREQSDIGAGYSSVEARVLRAEGRPSEALARPSEACSPPGALRDSATVKRASSTRSRRARLDDLRRPTSCSPPEDLQPGELTPYLEGHRARLRARIDARAGELTASTVTSHRRGRLRRPSVPFPLAVAQLEHAEWLFEQGRGAEAEPLLAEARETFVRLRAKPWRRPARPRAGRTPPKSPPRIVTVPAHAPADLIHTMAGWS